MTMIRDPSRRASGFHPGLLPIPHFRALTGHEPYPWQQCLYGQLVEGEVPEAVDIPTGLGKIGGMRLGESTGSLPAAGLADELLEF